MRTLVRAVLCVLALAAALPPRVHAQAEKPEAPAGRELTKTELHDLLKHFREKNADVRSVAIRFEQEKHLSLFKDVIKARGVCLFVRPDTVRFEFVEPFQSVMIAKGAKIAKYECLEGKWQKLKVGSSEIMTKVTEQIATWLKGEFPEKDGIYTLSARRDKAPTLFLTPRSEKLRKMIARIELRLDEKGAGAGSRRIASVVIREPGGDYSTMAFVDVRYDLDLPARLFDTARRVPAPWAFPVKKPSHDTPPNKEAK